MPYPMTDLYGRRIAESSGGDDAREWATAFAIQKARADKAAREQAAIQRKEARDATVAASEWRKAMLADAQQRQIRKEEQGARQFDALMELKRAEAEDRRAERAANATRADKLAQLKVDIANRPPTPKEPKPAKRDMTIIAPYENDVAFRSSAQRQAFADLVGQGVAPIDAAQQLNVPLRPPKEQGAWNAALKAMEKGTPPDQNSWERTQQSLTDALRARKARLSVNKATDALIQRKQAEAAAQRAIDDETARQQAEAEQQRKDAIIEERKKAQERLNQEAETRRQAEVEEAERKAKAEEARTATALKILQMAQPAAGQTTTNVPAAVVQHAVNVLTNNAQPATSTGGVAPEGFRYQRGGKTYVKRNGVFVVEQ